MGIFKVPKKKNSSHFLKKTANALEQGGPCAPPPNFGDEVISYASMHGERQETVGGFGEIPPYNEVLIFSETSTRVRIFIFLHLTPDP